MNLAIIPARAGSKRIPHKNTADLCGKPLIAYTIEAALGALSPGEVIVSTDCERVREVASRYGVMIHDRPADLCTDQAQLEDVVGAALEWLRPERDPRAILLLQPTSPLRGPARIVEALRLLPHDGYCESVVSVCELQHAQWCGHIEDGEFRTHYRPAVRPRTQDVLPLYSENGAIYGFQPETFRAYKCRTGGRIHALVMDRIESVDIDTPDDLTLAARLLPLVYRDGGWL